MKWQTCYDENLTWTGIDGVTRKFYRYDYNQYSFAPFPCFSTGGPKTSPSYSYLFPYASSNDNISETEYSVPNPIGTTSISTNRFGEQGWTMDIIINNNEAATIRSLYFVRTLNISSSSPLQTVIFILKLDEPVELNAENNYTANFTFAL